MVGQKRTRSGESKSQPASHPHPHQPQDTPAANTPLCSQALPSSTATDAEATTSAHGTKAPQTNAGTVTARTTDPLRADGARNPTISQHAPNALKTARTPSLKRARLPSNAIISKRPLLHAALPSPFASAEKPKVLYITRTSPFIPTCKRIRALLAQTQRRAAQSASEVRGRGRGSRGRGRGQLEANGRLSAADVEASIAEGAGRARGKRETGGGGEEVYLKATGRAIPRALELGVKFQGEDDCRVRVEMGRVQAIDDVEMQPSPDGEPEDEGEDMPETRIRVLSTVTVSIGLV